MIDLVRRGLSPSPPQVWAVEDDSIQVTWGLLPPGPIAARVSVGADPKLARSPGEQRELSVDHNGGPGSLVIDGLPAGRSVSISLLWEGGSTELSTSTLRPPPGQQLCRFATISDLHLGSRRWGALKTMVDRSGRSVPFPFRCASAAVEEALAWGCELLIIKGDAANHELAEDFDQVGRLADLFPELPMLLIPGNHDVDNGGTTIPLTVGRRALPYNRSTGHLDLPGVRVVVADTTVPGMGRGSLDRVAEPILDAVGDADDDRAAFVALHHQLQESRIPRYWPRGVDHPSSVRFLDRLAGIGKPVTVSSGHTHRNRTRDHRGVLVTEVASTKDWPAVWAGYAIHEGGIRQVVRRIARPDAIEWAEYSRRAVAGLWASWSPGPVDQRCLSRVWSRQTTSV
jgi:predicted phosphodiesterase